MMLILMLPMLPTLAKVGWVGFREKGKGKDQESNGGVDGNNGSGDSVVEEAGGSQREVGSCEAGHVCGALFAGCWLVGPERSRTVGGVAMTWLRLRLRRDVLRLRLRLRLRLCRGNLGTK